MGCQGQKCSVCGGTFPACQLKDGKCASCRAKEKQQIENKQEVKK